MKRRFCAGGVNYVGFITDFEICLELRFLGSGLLSFEMFVRWPVIQVLSRADILEIKRLYSLSGDLCY